MSETLIAVIYGIVQGITEFLPVSSSGHLALIPYFLGSKDPGVFFDLAMHIGTALAVIVSFRHKIVVLLKQSLHLTNDSKSHFARNFYFASFITILFVFMIKGYAESFGRSPNLIAFNLVFFGAIMWGCDFFGNKEIDLLKKTDLLRAGLIGLSQSLAIFPGVSRSGITLSSSRILGLSREAAASFSFLLSLPIIIGGFCYKLFGLFKNNALLEIDWTSLAVGVSVSFIIGLLTIKFFMALLSRVGLGIYFWYRLILAAIILYF